jgi:hypothetical protein
MTSAPSLRDERGTTLMEVVVALGAGTVVLFALSTIVITTLHGANRVSARVDANQRARLTMTRIVDQLHSACVAPQIAPIQEGSSGTTLIFVHQTGSAVAPTPVKSKIVLEGGTLTQYDYAATSGSAPKWEYATTPSPSLGRRLMTKISPIAPSTSIFGYYSYASGQGSPTPLETPLNAERAATAAKVGIAFSAAPLSTPVKDAGAATQIQGSAQLRLTPPSFSGGGVNLPCQ